MLRQCFREDCKKKGLVDDTRSKKSEHVQNLHIDHIIVILKMF